MKKLIAVATLYVVTLCLTIVLVPLNAQDACTAVIQDALTQDLQACLDTERGYVCYGAATTYKDGASLFNTPHNAINLSDIDRIETAAINMDDEQYGVAIMNVSANYPMGIGEKGVTFLMMGDVQLENEVLPAQSFTPIEPIIVTTVQGANLRTRPSTSDTVLFSVGGSAELLADGTNNDGDWLRVVYEDTPAWVYKPLVTGEGIDQLPTISSDYRSLMQSFSLLSGENAADSDCLYAPNTLIIQGLENQPAYLTVNGLDMYILSTVALRNIERPYRDFLNDSYWAARFPTFIQEDIPQDARCQFIQLSAIDGEAFLNNYRFSIPRGFRAHAFQCQNVNDEGLIFETQWDRPEQITFNDLAQLKVLETLPENTFRTAIELVTMQDISNTTTQLNILPTPVPYVPPVNTNTDSGLTVIEATSTPQPVGDCGGFRPTSPLELIGFGYVRFYWDPAVGATSYQVNVYNYAMELLSTAQATAPETSARLDITSLQFNEGSNRMPMIYYEVVAYQDGAVLCTTPLETVQRTMDPDPDCPQHLWFSGTCEDFIANDR